MPIYEYECAACGRIEVMQKASEAPLTLCPECDKSGKKSKVERVISASAFHLKGGGWYKTDYSSSSSGAASSSTTKTSESSGESSKSESSTSDGGEKKTLKASGPCGSGCGCG